MECLFSGIVQRRARHARAGRDQWGSPKTVVGPTGETRTRTFDALGRVLTSTISAAGDGCDQVADPHCNEDLTTTYENFPGGGPLHRVSGPGGAVTEYGCDDTWLRTQTVDRGPDRNLSDSDVFEAHKRQPTIEERFQQSKTVLEIAPVLLKNEARIEAFFLVFLLALFTQALVERHLRRAMKNSGVDELPLCPGKRMTRRPTADQVFRLFSHAQRHTLSEHGNLLRTFHPELTDLQKQIPDLIEVPLSAFT